MNLCSINVYANSEDKELGGYTVEGIANSNQLDPSVGYFYLHEDIGSEDSVKVRLTNSSSEDKTLNVKITNANTNVNGLVDYSGKLKDHLSLKTPMTSIATPTQTEVKIKMPYKKLSGVVIGGIVVSEKQPESNIKEKIALRNTYSYTLGLVVTNESKIELNKNVSVELDKVGATLFDGKKVVQADILNPNPYIFSKATVKGEILKKGTSEPLQKTEKENINIAPYSAYPFQFDWKKEDLKAGKYIFRGSVEASGKIWRFDKEFDISTKKAKKINQESVYKVVIPDWLTYSIYGLVTISIGGTIYLVLRRKNRKVG